MATIGSTLALFDRFSQTLHAAERGVARILAVSERLNQVLHQPATLTVDTTAAEASITQMRQRIESAGAGSAIQIVIDSGAITQEVLRIQNQIRTGLSGAAVDVTLNTTEALQQATTLRARIAALIGSINVNIQLGLEDASAIRTQFNEALRRFAATPVTIRPRLDPYRVMADLEALKQRIRTELSTFRARINIQFNASVTVLLTNLQRLALRLLTAVRRIGNASNNTAQLQNALERIRQLEERINQLQGEINSRMRQGASAAGGLLGKIKGIAAAYLSLQGVKNLFGATVGSAMDQFKMEDMFKARTGDAEVGTAMFEKFKADALAAGQDVNDTLKSTLSFFSATQNTDQLSQLNMLASRMAAFDSSGNGIEGAAFALKEAMSGDIVSLAERFNMSKSDIRAFKIDELGKSGDMDGFIKAFDQLLEKQKMGQAAFDTMMASPAKQVEVLGNNLRSAFTDAGGSAVQALMPLITMLNQAFQSGQFDAFFENLSNGLAWVVEQAVRLYEVFAAISSFITSNWSTIEPILTGVGGALLGLYAALKLIAVGQAIVNAVMKADPIILIVTVVVALILWLIRLWQTNDQFAAALFRAWNAILNFFDQIPIFFTIVGNGITNAFQTAKVKSLEIMEDLVNGVIDDINRLIDMLNKIPGVSIQALGHVQFSAKAAAEADAIRQAGEDAVRDMKSAAKDRAAEREQKVQDMVNGREAKRAAEEAEKAAKDAKANEDILAKWNSGAGSPKNIDKVGEVGKIKDKVDISSEDLEVMRDLAEMRAIQNFVSLTPTVEITTGPITKEVDIDEVISRIGPRVQEELEASANGVYPVR